MSNDPKSFNQPGRDTLNNTDVGGVGEAVLTLTKELWVLRDRFAVLEAVLANKGIDVSEDIQNFQPDVDMQRELDQQSTELVEKILEALNGR